jgi:hypothetical protein
MPWSSSMPSLSPLYHQHHHNNHHHHWRHGPISSSSSSSSLLGRYDLFVALVIILLCLPGEDEQCSALYVGPALMPHSNLQQHYNNKNQHHRTVQGVPTLATLLRIQGTTSTTRTGTTSSFVASHRGTISLQAQKSSFNLDSSFSSSSSVFSFEDMKELDTRLASWMETAPESLLDFYEPHLLSFSVKPGGSVNRLSITSTCYAVLALLQSSSSSSSSPSTSSFSSSWSMEDDDETSENGSTATTTTTTTSQRPKLKSILQALLHSEWRKEDLFQVSLLTYTLLYAAPNRTALIEGMLLQDINTNTENDSDDENDKVNYNTTDDDSAILQRLVSLVLAARPQRRLGSSQQIFSDYIQFQCCRVYALLRDTLQKLPSSDPGSSVSSQRQRRRRQELEVQVTLSLTRCAETSLNELCRQLAYRSAGDTTSFDVVRLAYSLLSYVKSTQSLSGSSSSSSSSSTMLQGRELTQSSVVMRNIILNESSSGAGGEKDSTSTTSTTTVVESIPPLNRQLVTAAVQAFFDEQSSKDGLWPQGQPIYKSFRRQGRNVGNAFVFSLDTVGSLLEALSPEEVRPHLPALERALQWIETHQLVEVIPERCDDDKTTPSTSSFQCYGKPLRGWSSPHLSLGSGPQSWSTAQVVTCLTRMKSTVRKLMHTDVLEEFQGIKVSQKGQRPESWNRLLDSDLGRRQKKTSSSSSGEGGDCRTIKSVLDERVCRPFASESTSIFNPSFGAAYSTILFGPPGTAKTTICEALAERMGWDFVVIDTTAFLADGLTNVASRIRYVFRRLMALTECVILFDEIEEFCLDRETPGLSMESRMLTTAMLTAINDLRRTKRSVFFVATNRLRAFDSAIIRPGRFDLQLFVGTPNLESRVVLFRQALRDVNVRDPTVTEQVVTTYRSFLNSVWSLDEDAMYMNYLEGRQFATLAANLVVMATPVMASSGGGGDVTTTTTTTTPPILQTEELHTILKQQAAVMTVRGSVREEYIASMELSRL